MLTFDFGYICIKRGAIVQSVQRLATCWTVPGIESRWVRDFPHPSRPALGPTQPPIMGTGSFTGVKSPGRGADHPPPSSAEVEEREELYTCPASGSSWPVIGRALPLLTSRLHNSIKFSFARCSIFGRSDPQFC